MQGRTIAGVGSVGSWMYGWGAGWVIVRLVCDFVKVGCDVVWCGGVTVRGDRDFACVDWDVTRVG
jgi:hypothetical protein